MRNMPEIKRDEIFIMVSSSEVGKPQATLQDVLLSHIRQPIDQPHRDKYTSAVLGGRFARMIDRLGPTTEN